ncbi:MAG: SLBB domain-containing protein [Bacteroidetes bacterium]|nr:SLBB domain-containing protein [Bacteroidota bacterium]
MKSLYIVILTGIILFNLTIADAQDISSSLLSATSEKTTNTNYFFARPNDITIIVNVMGFVQRPGRYEIGSSIDLMNLIALAGGPTTDGSLAKVKIIRIIKDGEKTIRQDVQPDQKTLSSFLKEEAKITRQEIHLDLNNLSTVRPEDLQMMPGDIVYLDRTTWSTIRDVFSVVVSAAIITQAISIAVDGR